MIFLGGGFFLWGDFFGGGGFFVVGGGICFFRGGFFCLAGGVLFFGWGHFFYSTVWFCTVQYCTIQYSTVLYNRVQYKLQYSTGARRRNFPSEDPCSSRRGLWVKMLIFKVLPGIQSLGSFGKEPKLVCYFLVKRTIKQWWKKTLVHIRRGAGGRFSGELDLIHQHVFLFIKKKVP